MLIGIDDTDSLKGMCTTYIAAKICHEIQTEGFPKLVRLNPNIPFKTRGNGAIALRTYENPEKVKEVVTDIVQNFSRVDDRRTNPGVVFVEENEANKKILTYFYKKVVSELVSIKEAEEIGRQVGAEIFRLKNGRGIIGALASLGFDPQNTSYELIAYRVPANYGKKRLIDEDSVLKMNKKFFPNVFDSIDEETGGILITPRGYDPIFCGIRGKSSKYVKEAWDMIKPLEEIESFLVFETNQGTDDHLRDKKIADIKPYDCVRVEGQVSFVPWVVEGGHVVFGLSDLTGFIDCAAYKPTGGFRNVIKNLALGDEVVVCGGIGKYLGTVNMEKLYVKNLTEVSGPVVPKCCGRNMTSAGKNKGFKCKKCSKKVSQKEVKTVAVQRNIQKGWYEVPPRARRHLSRPLALDL